MTTPRLLLPLTIVFLLAETAAVGSMTFVTRTVSVTARANDRIVWYGAEAPSGRHLNESFANVNGVAEYTSPADLKTQAIWIAIDSDTGEVQVDSPTAGLAATKKKSVPAIFPRDAAGLPTRVAFQGTDASELVWVRPGVGEWTLIPFEPGVVDLDGERDGVLVASASNFTPVISAHSVPPPATFAPTDIIAGVSSDLRYFVGAPILTVAGTGAISMLGATSLGTPLPEGSSINTIVFRGGGFDDATFTYDGAGVTPGTVKFVAGAHAKSLRLELVDDGIWSGAMHTVYVQFHGSDGNTSGPAFSVLVSEEGFPPSVAIEASSVKEGDAAGQRVDFTFILTGRTSLPASVTFAPGVFTPVSPGPLVFAPGETRKTFAFTFDGDRLVQGNRVVPVRIAAVSGCSVSANAVTVVDDDASLLTPEDASGDESGGAMRFTVRLDVPSPAPIGLIVDTASGTAIEGVDFVGIHHSFTIPAGIGTWTFEVPLIRDAVSEQPETFRIALGAAGATLSRTTATGTILDKPAVSIADVHVSEGNAGTSQVKVRISIAPVSSEPVQFRFATFDDTATTGSDFLPRNATTTIPAGASGVTETFTIVGDDVIEPDETFRIVLSSVTGAIVDRGAATVTIVDDDAPIPVVSIDDAAVIETNGGATAATFRLHLDRTSTDLVTVTWSASDGTASSLDDYATSGGSVTFAPGQLDATIVVMVKGDTIVEPDEDFFVTLTAPVNARLGNESARGLILNDDGLRRGRVAGH
jgi:hypothetical protein